MSILSTLGNLLDPPAGPAKTTGHESRPSAQDLVERHDVVGESQSNPDGTDRQRIIRDCRVGDPIWSSDNPYDPNAVVVFTVKRRQIG